MKRFLLLAVVLLFSAASLSGLDNKYDKYFSFKVTPQFEIANGLIQEYVFDPKCKNTDNKLSQLDWHLSTIALFNLQADFDILRFGALGFTVTAGVPQRSDYMQDYDWQNSVTTAWLNDDPTELTNFSEHVNHLDKFINYKLYLGGNIYLPLEIKITPYLGYQYEFIRFTGSQGYGEYKNKKKGIDKLDFAGNVISYEQELNTFILGIKLLVNSIPRTSINLDFDISPNMTYLNAIDYHYVNGAGGAYGTAFKDSFKNLMLIDSSLIAQYRFTKNHSAGISGRIQYIPLSKGTTSSRVIDKNGNFKTDEWQPIKSSYGGTERFIWSFGFNYSFSL